MCAAILVSRPPPDRRQLVPQLLLSVAPNIDVSETLLRLGLSVGTKDEYSIAVYAMILGVKYSVTLETQPHA
jgi:hypothetical protein